MKIIALFSIILLVSLTGVSAYATPLVRSSDYALHTVDYLPHIYCSELETSRDRRLCQAGVVRRSNRPSSIVVVAPSYTVYGNYPYHYAVYSSSFPTYSLPKHAETNLQRYAPNFVVQTPPNPYHPLHGHYSLRHHYAEY